jgi:hypothetical protein
MTLSLPTATTLSDDITAPVSAEYRDLAPMITRQRYVRTTRIVAKEF